MAVATGLTVVVGAPVVGRGDGADDDVRTGRGLATRTSVAVFVAEDVDVPPSAGVEVREDGTTLGSLADPARPTWFETTTRSGAVEVVLDGEVLEEQTGEPGDRLVLSLGDCTSPSAQSRRPLPLCGRPQLSRFFGWGASPPGGRRPARRRW